MPENFLALTSSRLDFHPFKESFQQATDLYQVIQKNKEFLPFLPQLTHLSSAEEVFKLLLDGIKKRIDKKEFSFIINLKGSSQIIGCITLQHINLSTRCAELSYWLDNASRGQGYMTEAMQAMENACFTNGFNRLGLAIASGNTKSEVLAKRLGYKLEGVLRDFWLNPECPAHSDKQVFGKLYKEWAASHT